MRISAQQFGRIVGGQSEASFQGIVEYIIWNMDMDLGGHKGVHVLLSVGECGSIRRLVAWLLPTSRDKPLLESSSLRTLS